MSALAVAVCSVALPPERAAATDVTPTVLSTRFADDRDEITIDMKSAYDVPSLTSLQRTARYIRTESGAVEIEDAFAFNSPQTFEVPLVTVGGDQRNADGTVDLWQKDKRVRASIEASAAYELVEEKIDEENYVFYRIAIRLTDPQPAGKVTVRFTPLTSGE
jgi:hypothetical protein